MNPTLNKVFQVAIVILLIVGGLGPTVAGLAGDIPPGAFTVVSHVVAVCAGLALYVTQSPLFAPWLPSRSPAAIITAEKVRAVETAAKVAGACMALVVFMSLAGCAWFKANGGAVATDITAVGFCELEYIEQTATPTPEGAVTACIGLAITDAQRTFETLAAETLTDGGVDAGAPLTARAKKIRAAKGVR